MMAGVAMSSLRSAFASCGLALLLASATHAVSAAEVTFVLRIQNGRVPENMRLIRVKQNDVVKLQWSSDKAISLHLHGYDIEKAVAPGAVTEMTFTARATGRFTVAPHLAAQPGGGHAHGDALVTIEVYP
jgi:heme/copper-type cytochrome/quinol oxidase subunit 2